MRLFTRYVLREITQVFLVTLASLTVLLVVIIAVQKAIGQGLGLAQFVQMVPYLLPNALMFAVPGTILFSVASVYGRMSGSNEIVALKSAGLSPLVVLWPALLLASLLSLTTVWLNDLAMSWGFHGVQRVIVDALEDIAYGMLRTQPSFSTPAFSVTVKKVDVDGRRLISPVFVLPANENSGEVRIHAELAELKSNPGSGVLTIKLYNGTVDAGGFHAEMPDQWWERDIVIDPNVGGADFSPAHLSLAEIPGRVAQEEQTIQSIEQRMVAQAGFQVLTGDFETLTGGGWANDTNLLRFEKNRLYRMQTEPPRRWANGFSCLCFALVGAVMAIRVRNSDVLTSFFLCFGPILLVYYPLLLFGVDRAKAGAINPHAVWLGNVALVLWGLWLLRRVLRY